MVNTDITVLVLGTDYWRSHPILLLLASLGFAAIMILSDRQDAGRSHQGDLWPLRMGVLLLAGFTAGAAEQKLWSSFVIGLAALYFDLWLLRRIHATPITTAPRSWMPLTFGLSQWKKNQQQDEALLPTSNLHQEREDR